MHDQPQAIASVTDHTMSKIALEHALFARLITWMTDDTIKTEIQRAVTLYTESLELTISTHRIFTPAEWDHVAGVLIPNCIYHMLRGGYSELENMREMLRGIEKRSRTPDGLHAFILKCSTAQTNYRRRALAEKQ
jgi:hypothetical protein